MSDRDKLIEAAARESHEYFAFKLGVEFADANPKRDERVERLIDAVNRVLNFLDMGTDSRGCHIHDILSPALQEFEAKNG